MSILDSIATDENRNRIIRLERVVSCLAVVLFKDKFAKEFGIAPEDEKKVEQLLAIELNGIRTDLGWGD